jgi:hypothetical protein
MRRHRFRALISPPALDCLRRSHTAFGKTASGRRGMEAGGASPDLDWGARMKRERPTLFSHRVHLMVPANLSRAMHTAAMQINDEQQ